jgi:AcrR family transcriptional regulator
MRADAQRNRDAILRAARETFEAEGVLASLDGIAARAGVGNATLYRNFPTRESLLAAVMHDSVDVALDEATRLADRLAPGAALAEWLVLLAWRLRIWNDLPSCIATSGDERSSLRAVTDPLIARTDDILARARSTGQLTTAVTARELFELVTALAWAIDRFGDDEGAARRRVTLATAGVFMS